jgi:chorismate synthase
MPRPSHGDYTGFIKYGGFNDYRGGGHFSGRLTAPLVFAGSICRKLLEQEGIIIGSHVKSIGSIEDSPFDLAAIDKDLLEKLRASSLPLIDASKEEEVRDAIIKAKSENDSLGGVIETAIINVKPGIGNPFFDSVESILAHLMFSIPGVKGIEFGAGFNISRMTGSQANDEFYAENSFVRTYTNNNGGILGGITNGMPIVFRVAFKPTASIGKAQRTIDMEKLENTVMELKGRHDPCIVPRAVPVVEAMAAIGMLDLML